MIRGFQNGAAQPSRPTGSQDITLAALRHIAATLHLTHSYRVQYLFLQKLFIKLQFTSIFRVFGDWRPTNWPQVAASGAIIIDMMRGFQKGVALCCSPTD